MNLSICQFVKDGMPEGVAVEGVDQANNYTKSEFRKAGSKTLLIGVGLLALGGVITLITYSAASGGGTYMVTTGLSLVGGILVMRGLVSHSHRPSATPPPRVLALTTRFNQRLAQA